MTIGSMLKWRIELLGGLRLREVGSDSSAQTKFYSQKVALLLALLAFPPMRTRGREEIVDMLWPESDLLAGRASLRNTLSHLRRQLEPFPEVRGRILESNSVHLRLDPECIETDVADFRRALAAAAKSGGEGEYEEHLQEALELYRGELLHNYYSEWVFQERDALTRAYAEAMRALQTVRERQGDRVGAQDLISQLARLAEHEVVVEKSPAPGSVQVSPTAYLPTFYTHFYGRTKEIQELLVLLKSERLVTLTGIGGVGKTRLVRQIAQEFSSLAGGGAAFIPLEAVQEPEQMAGKIVAVLGIPPVPDKDPLREVSDALKLRGITLLALDNMEQLLSGGKARRTGEFLSDLLQENVLLRLITTSRQELLIKGERLYPVEPLPVPSSKEPVNVERLLLISSVQLFADRARLARADFALTARNAVPIADICRHLEGIPLALEIAAARTLVTTPWEMRTELKRRLDFLVRRPDVGNRERSARHLSIRSALDWSFDLLSEPVRQFFALLALFRGGFTTEFARFLSQDDAALDNQEDLCRASLLWSYEHNAQMRFQLLDTVRDFALEKLRESGDEAKARARHFQAFHGLVERSYAERTGIEQNEWHDRLEVEHDNIRAALEWGLVQTDCVPMLQMIKDLCHFWQTRGHLNEGIQWSQRALARVDEDVAPTDDLRLMTAKAQNSLGTLLSSANCLAEAEALFASALTVLEEMSHEDTIGPLNNLGLIYVYQARYEPAIETFSRCLALIAVGGEDKARFVPAILNNRAMTFSRAARFEEAEKDVLKALQLYQETGNKRGTAKALNNLGNLALMQGSLMVAQERLQESLRLHHVLGDLEGAASCLEEIARCLLAENQAVSSANLLGAALAIRRQINAPVRPVDQPAMDQIQESLIVRLGASLFEEILHKQSQEFTATLEAQVDA